MASDPVHELITSIRTRVESELDAYAPALVARYQATVAEARKEADAAADRRWSSLLEAQKSEARQQLEAAIASARAESQHRWLLNACREIDAATTLSAVLTGMSAAAESQSSRARLYLGPEFDPWNAGAAEAPPVALVEVLREAAKTFHSVKHQGNGIAVPLVLDGHPIAVLYAETPNATQSWVEAIELLVRHGAAHLGYLTAVRTARAQQWIAGYPTGRSAGAPHLSTGDAGDEGDAVQSAKRYARLLVSEIKLYNETAVGEGRDKRDLARRLGPEIDRARRLYEERVPSSVIDRARHFHHELVQTLAGGDPALLG